MRMIVLLIITPAVAGVGAVYALAGHTPDEPPSYTGCLNTSSGAVNDLAAGDAPADACSIGEVEVHLGVVGLIPTHVEGEDVERADPGHPFTVRLRPAAALESSAVPLSRQASLSARGA